MEDVFLLGIILVTAYFFYCFGICRAERKRRKKNNARDYRKTLTKPAAACCDDAAAKKEPKEPNFYYSAIAEGYANMATGGAFIKSKKRGEGLFK